MSATIDNLYDAVATALAGLGPSPGTGAFASVTDFAGEVTQEQIEKTTLRKYPACLLALASEDSSEATLNTTTGDMQTVVRTQLVVYIVALSIRGTRRAHEDQASGTKGLFSLASLVIGALNGRVVEGLWGTSRVHYAGMRPQLMKLGAFFVYALRFQSDRVAEQYENTVTTNAFDSIEGEVNLVNTDETEEPAANPIARVGRALP